MCKLKKTLSKNSINNWFSKKRLKLKERKPEQSLILKIKDSQPL